MVKRLVITLAGVALMLGYWTLRGRSSAGGGDAPVGNIPAKVWEGGGTSVTVELDTNTKARFSIWFTEHPEGEEEKRNLETWENVEPGHKEWTIDVPKGVGGHIEASAVPGKQGDSLAWKVRNPEKLIVEHAERLDQPLQPGYAFAIQDVVLDFAAGKVEGR